MSEVLEPKKADRPYDLVIFDWDGTVIDSVGTVTATMSSACLDVGSIHPSEEQIRATIGLGLSTAFEELLGSASISPTADLLAAHVRAYRHHWFGGNGRKSMPFKGAQETLSRLVDEGYWLAIATGKGRRGLLADLERTGFGHLFLALRTPDDGPAKPNPWMTTSILDDLGVQSSRAMVIGDSRHDLKMAEAAKVDAVAVNSGAASRSHLEACQPIAILDDLTSLPGWLAEGQEAHRS